MKRLIAFATMILAAATLNTSCEGVENKVEYLAELASIVDGTPETGNFYVIFDNGQKAFVTNSNQITIPQQAYTDGEARAIIQYSIDGSRTGFDKCIKIADLFPIVTERVTIKTEKGIDYDVMKSSFNIKNAYIARDYINLDLEYMYSENPTSHNFHLVYNDTPELNEDGLFYGNYMDDGYLHLELFYDPGREVSIETYETFISFKFDPEKLHIDNIDDYLGIKILYRSFNEKNQNYDYVINFK